MISKLCAGDKADCGPLDDYIKEGPSRLRHRHRKVPIQLVVSYLLAPPQKPISLLPFLHDQQPPPPPSLRVSPHARHVHRLPRSGLCPPLPPLSRRLVRADGHRRTIRPPRARPRRRISYVFPSFIPPLSLHPLIPHRREPFP